MRLEINLEERWAGTSANVWADGSPTLIPYAEAADVYTDEDVFDFERSYTV